MSEGDRRSEQAELELARRLRQLPASIEPARDLWPGIAARLSAREPARTGGFSWQSLAAAVALVAISSTATLWWAERDEVPAFAAARGPVALARYDVPGTAYLQARASLAIDVESRLSRLPPHTQAMIRENLGQIARALEEIGAALARDPDSVLLQQLLLATYQQELNVLTDLAQVIEAASKTRMKT